MARVTVEDCVKRLTNRFDLVIKAAERARQIGQGAEITVERDNDKNTVVSLREIAGDTVDLKNLKSSLVKKHQLVAEAGSEDDIEVADLMKDEQSWVLQPESSAMNEEIKSDHLEVVSEESLETTSSKSEVFEDVSSDIAD